jgi:hypothetical protein
MFDIFVWTLKGEGKLRQPYILCVLFIRLGLISARVGVLVFH